VIPLDGKGCSKNNQNGDEAMKRRTLDLILTAGGAMLVVVLIVAGVLLVIAANYTNNQVHTQLARQEIYFPKKATMYVKGSPTAKERSVILPYAGQQVLTGDQAKAYAYKVEYDFYYTVPFHGVYSKLSNAAREHPTTKKLAALVTTSFRGTTLQGLLLEAYAFSVFGEIATAAWIASFVLAALMLILTVLGFIHLRKVPENVEFPKPH